MDRIGVMHVIRPSEGGIRNHLLSLAGQSDRGRFEHMVACPEAMTRHFADGGIKIFPLPLGGDVEPVKDLAAARLLHRLLRENRVNIVHVHGSKAGLVGRPAALLAGVPAVVMTVHNSVLHDHLPRWKVNMLVSSERILAFFTSQIIAVSEALRRELITRHRVGPDRVVTVYNGIAPEIFSAGTGREYLERLAGIPPGRVIVGTVARLAPQKGLQHLIRAASLLAAGNSKAVFVIVGDGPLREDLKSQVRMLNLEDRFFFTGQRQDVHRLMSCFDLFVLPSLTEGLPLTILEAMAAGRPVVATRVGGIPEVVEDGVSGLLVEPGDAGGLARAVAFLAGSGEVAQRMGRRGRIKVIEQFTTGKMVRETEKIYSRLISHFQPLNSHI